MGTLPDPHITPLEVSYIIIVPNPKMTKEDNAQV